MLAPGRIRAVGVAVRRAVVQARQEVEAGQRQLRRRDAQLLRQLPHGCALHTPALRPRSPALSLLHAAWLFGCGSVKNRRSRNWDTNDMHACMFTASMQPIPWRP
jgi:hypothetical protein